MLPHCPSCSQTSPPFVAEQAGASQVKNPPVSLGALCAERQMGNCEKVRLAVQLIKCVKREARLFERSNYFRSKKYLHKSCYCLQILDHSPEIRAPSWVFLNAWDVLSYKNDVFGIYGAEVVEMQKHLASLSLGVLCKNE